MGRLQNLTLGEPPQPAAMSEGEGRWHDADTLGAAFPLANPLASSDADDPSRRPSLEAMQARIVQAQRLEALGRIAGGIAHDVNNLLQSIATCLDLAESQRTEPEEVSRMIALARDATWRGAEVTRRLLGFLASPGAEPRPVDPGAVLKGLEDLIRLTVGSGVAVLTVASPGPLPAIHDHGELDAVLLNLAANARDAMEGQGRLTLSATPDRLHGQPCARISVADTGCGMAPEVLSQATDAFFTTKAAAGGTGLGLSLARDFAEARGGRLLIRSAPRLGTTISLLLPAVDGPGARRAA